MRLWRGVAAQAVRAWGRWAASLICLFLFTFLVKGPSSLFANFDLRLDFSVLLTASNFTPEAYFLRLCSGVVPSVKLDLLIYKYESHLIILFPQLLKWI